MLKLSSFFEKNLSKIPFIAFDILAMPFAWILVYWLKYASDGIVSHLLAKNALVALSILIIGQMICYFKFKVYRGLWHYASLDDVVRVMQATIVSILISEPLMYFIAIFKVVPRRVLPVYCLILMALLCSGRLVFRYWAEKKHGYFCKPNENIQRILIVGAGHAGAGLVRDLKRTTTYLPVGFVDEDKSKQGLELYGVLVLGSLDHLPELVHKFQVDLLFIAIPSANSADMRRIVV